MTRCGPILLAIVGAVAIGCDRSPQLPAANQAELEAPPKPEPLATAAPGKNALDDSVTVAATTPVASSDLPQRVPLTAEDWPQFRGPSRDAISREHDLLQHWPADGPEVVWQTVAGEGYASPVAVGGRVYFNDYDEDQQTWLVRCLALDDGQEFWRYEVKKRIRPNHGITRSAPATDGVYVMAIDPKCELHCLHAGTGEMLWKKNLPQEYGGPIPAWYNGQCPLLDGKRLIIAPGGRALLAAFDPASGGALWETPNPDGWNQSHSSPMPAVIDGVTQYLYTTLQGVVGVDAETGELLWSFPWKFNTAVTTTPLPLGDGRFFLTAGYHARTVICQVQRVDGRFTASEATSLPPPTKGWNSEVHTPLVHRGYIWGVGKKQRGLWTCLSMDGEEIWTSQGQAAFGMGGYLLADDKFFVLEGTTGTLRVLDARADEYRELAHFQAIEGSDVWAPPVLSRGRLLIRDSTKLVCLDLREHSDAPPRAKPREAI